MIRLLSVSSAAVLHFDPFGRTGTPSLRLGMWGHAAGQFVPHSIDIKLLLLGMFIALLNCVHMLLEIAEYVCRFDDILVKEKNWMGVKALNS